MSDSPEHRPHAIGTPKAHSPSEGIPPVSSSTSAANDFATQPASAPAVAQISGQEGDMPAANDEGGDTSSSSAAGLGVSAAESTTGVQIVDVTATAATDAVTVVPELATVPQAEPEPATEEAADPAMEAATDKERAEVQAAARILSEKEANKQAREEARLDEERRLAEQAAAEEEKLARQKRLDEERKARQARRAAKMKKRQEELNKERQLRIIAQYCLTKENKRLGKVMRIALDDLRVFRMTEKKMQTLELKKGHMVTTGEYEFDDPQFTAKPVPGTVDHVALTVTAGKKAKAKEKVYICGDRPSLLQDLAFAIFKANMMEPRRFQCRKYTRNDRYVQVGVAQRLPDLNFPV